MTRWLPTALAVVCLAGCGLTQTTSTPSATTQTITATQTTTEVQITSTPTAPCKYRTFPDGAIAPDRSCTPGIVNPYAAAHPYKTVCVPGYAERVRPPEAITEPLKLQLMARYQDPNPSGSYQLDHLVAIEDGGSPTSVENMWPQPIAQAVQKDRLEDLLHEQICAHRLSVVQAARELEGDWLWYLPPVTEKGFETTTGGG